MNARSTQFPVTNRDIFEGLYVDTGDQAAVSRSLTAIFYANALRIYLKLDITGSR